MYSTKKSSFMARGGSGEMSNTRMHPGGTHHKHQMTISPVGTLLRNVGPTESSWDGKHIFNAALQKMGQDYYGRMNGSSLPPVQNGSSLGDSYYKGMNTVYNFIKNGQNMNAAGDGMGVSQEQASVERDPFTQ